MAPEDKDRKGVFSTRIGGVRLLAMPNLRRSCPRGPNGRMEIGRTDGDIFVNRDKKSVSKVVKNAWRRGRYPWIARTKIIEAAGGGFMPIGKLGDGLKDGRTHPVSQWITDRRKIEGRGVWVGVDRRRNISEAATLAQRCILPRGDLAGKAGGKRWWIRIPEGCVRFDLVVTPVDGRKIKSGRGCVTG